MRAEVPTPSPDKQGSRTPLLAKDRRPVILFAVLTLVLAVATISCGRIWLKNSETLSAGKPGGPEARSAAMLTATSSRLRGGAISSDRLDTSRLGYEFVRDETGVRRGSLRRQGGHDDNVAVVKPVQSA